MAKKTLSSTKKRAWKVFSEYIRRKYAKNGMCACVTCGCVKPWSEMQAGHAMAGRNNAILYEERLVRPQCVACNMFKGGMPDEYHAWMLKEYGEDGYYELLRLKHSTRKFTMDELEEMIKEWREEIAKM